MMYNNQANLNQQQPQQQQRHQIPNNNFNDDNFDSSESDSDSDSDMDEELLPENNGDANNDADNGAGPARNIDHQENRNNDNNELEDDSNGLRDRENAVLERMDYINRPNDLLVADVLETDRNRDENVPCFDENSQANFNLSLLGEREGGLNLNILPPENDDSSRESMDVDDDNDVDLDNINLSGMRIVSLRNSSNANDDHKLDTGAGSSGLSRQYFEKSTSSNYNISGSDGGDDDSDTIQNKLLLDIEKIRNDSLGSSSNRDHDIGGTRNGCDKCNFRDGDESGFDDECRRRFCESFPSCKTQRHNNSLDSGSSNKSPKAMQNKELKDMENESESNNSHNDNKVTCDNETLNNSNENNKTTDDDEECNDESTDDSKINLNNSNNKGNVNLDNVSNNNENNVAIDKDDEDDDADVDNEQASSSASGNRINECNCIVDRLDNINGHSSKMLNLELVNAHKCNCRKSSTNPIPEPDEVEPNLDNVIPPNDEVPEMRGIVRPRGDNNQDEQNNARPIKKLKLNNGTSSSRNKTPRTIFHKALDAVNMSWDNQHLKNILASDQYSTTSTNSVSTPGTSKSSVKSNFNDAGQPLWHEPLSMCAARIDSLRSHGHTDAALRLSVSVVRTIKQIQRDAQSLWKKYETSLEAYKSKTEEINEQPEHCCCECGDKDRKKPPTDANPLPSTSTAAPPATPSTSSSVLPSNDSHCSGSSSSKSAQLPSSALNKQPYTMIRYDYLGNNKQIPSTPRCDQCVNNCDRYGMPNPMQPSNRGPCYRSHEYRNQYDFPGGVHGGPMHPNMKRSSGFPFHNDRMYVYDPMNHHPHSLPNMHHNHQGQRFNNYMPGTNPYPPSYRCDPHNCHLYQRKMPTNDRSMMLYNCNNPGSSRHGEYHNYDNVHRCFQGDPPSYESRLENQPSANTPCTSNPNYPNQSSFSKVCDCKISNRDRENRQNNSENQTENVNNTNEPKSVPPIMPVAPGTSTNASTSSMESSSQQIVSNQISPSQPVPSVAPAIPNSQPIQSSATPSTSAAAFIPDNKSASVCKEHNKTQSCIKKFCCKLSPSDITPNATQSQNPMPKSCKMCLPQSYNNCTCQSYNSSHNQYGQPPMMRQSGLCHKQYPSVNHHHNSHMPPCYNTYNSDLPPTYNSFCRSSRVDRYAYMYQDLTTNNYNRPCSYRGEIDDGSNAKKYNTNNFVNYGASTSKGQPSTSSSLLQPPKKSDFVRNKKPNCIADCLDCSVGCDVEFPLDAVACIFDCLTEACIIPDAINGPDMGRLTFDSISTSTEDESVIPPRHQHVSVPGSQDSNETYLTLAFEAAILALGKQRIMPQGLYSQHVVSKQQDEFINRLRHIDLDRMLVEVLKNLTIQMLDDGPTSGFGVSIHPESVPMHALARFLFESLLNHYPNLAFQSGLRAMRLPVLEDRTDISGEFSSVEVDQHYQRDGFIMTRCPRWWILVHLESQQCVLSSTMLSAAKGDSLRLTTVLQSARRNIHNSTQLFKLAQDAFRFATPESGPRSQTLLSAAFELGLQVMRMTLTSPSWRRRDMVRWLVTCATHLGVDALNSIMQNWMCLFTPTEATGPVATTIMSHTSIMRLNLSFQVRYYFNISSIL